MKGCERPWEGRRGGLDSFVRVGSIFELAGKVPIVSSHVEMPVTREREIDRLCLTRAIAFESFVDSDANRVVAFGRGDNSLGAGENDSRFEGGTLRNRDRFDETFVI